MHVLSTPQIFVMLVPILVWNKLTRLYPKHFFTIITGDGQQQKLEEHNSNSYLVAVLERFEHECFHSPCMQPSLMLNALCAGSVRTVTLKQSLP